MWVCACSQDTCWKGYVCVHLIQAVCICMCNLLAGVYVSGLIWQALLGCRQAGSWIMAPALLAGRTHLKEQQVENAILSFLSLSFSPPPLLYLCLSFCLSLLDGRWQWPGLARAVEDLASASFPHSLSLSPSLCVVIDW